MSNILTDKSKGKLKESGAQTAVTLITAILGGITGQAIGRTGFVASIPVIFAGEYFDQPYVTSFGAGMSSALTAPTSVNGLGNTPTTEKKFIDLKAAETRVKNYVKAVQKAAFLGGTDTETGSSYSYYLSESDMKQEDMGRLMSHSRHFPNKLQARNKQLIMSKIAPYMEGLGEALALHDDYLDGYEDVDYSEIIHNIKTNLEGIRDAVYENPNELMGINDDDDDLEGIDDETLEVINGIIGTIDGASMQGLSGNDEEFIEDLSEQIGALEGLLGLEDDEDDELNGDFDEDEFDANLNGSADEFSNVTNPNILFGFDEEDDDLGGYDDFEDVIDGLF